jgi:hypothetical protein
MNLFRVPLNAVLITMLILSNYLNPLQICLAVGSVQFISLLGSVYLVYYHFKNKEENKVDECINSQNKQFTKLPNNNKDENVKDFINNEKKERGGFSYNNSDEIKINSIFVIRFSKSFKTYSKINFDINSLDYPYLIEYKINFIKNSNKIRNIN